MKKSLSIYSSHDSSICINPQDGVYRIYELERFLQERYCKVNDKQNLEEILQNVYNEIKKEYPDIEFDTCYFGKTGLTSNENEWNILKRVFGVNQVIATGHHLSHSACAFYQSPFEKSLILSYDGGGFDEDNQMRTFNLFVGDKTNNKILRVYEKTIDIGNAYSLIAIPIKELRKGNYLSYAGKIMGLCAYGNIRQEWIEPMKNFYRTQFFHGDHDLRQLSVFGNQIGLNLSCPDSIEGQDSFDLAATSQYVFEEITLEIILPLIESFGFPVCLTGGCGLNVLFNERLRTIIGSDKLFVPPNPNDCGLSLGQLLLNEPPAQIVDITYNGFELLDRDSLNDHIQDYKAEKIDEAGIAKIISEGKIIGIANGKSECGPRALGNRSIICDPSFPDMKDVLNSKVKFREWFRPFAPIVKKNASNTFFDFDGDSTHMTFAPKTREEYKNKLQSIVHADGTARVQTITKEQNDFIYTIIDELEKINVIPVILNTSFNVKGKPILTTISEALDVLENTEIDHVVIEGYLFTAKNKIKK